MIYRNLWEQVNHLKENIFIVHVCYWPHLELRTDKRGHQEVRGSPNDRLNIGTLQTRPTRISRVWEPGASLYSSHCFRTSSQQTNMSEWNSCHISAAYAWREEHWAVNTNKPLRSPNKIDSKIWAATAQECGSGLFCCVALCLLIAGHQPPQRRQSSNTAPTSKTGSLKGKTTSRTVRGTRRTPAVRQRSSTSRSASWQLCQAQAMNVNGTWIICTAISVLRIRTRSSTPTRLLCAKSSVTAFSVRAEAPNSKVARSAMLTRTGRSSADHGGFKSIKKRTASVSSTMDIESPAAGKDESDAKRRVSQWCYL